MKDEPWTGYSELTHPLDGQVGGAHYKEQKLQPVEACYQRYGWAGVKASMHLKIDKYLTRNKTDEGEDIDKAMHCMELLKYYWKRSIMDGTSSVD